MGLFSKKSQEEKNFNREKNAVFMGETQQTIGNIPVGKLVSLRLDPANEKLLIVLGQTEISLPYNRITGFAVESETNLVNGKVSIGGAVVGAAFFGGVGALIGANKNKGKTKNKWFASLTYIDKDGNPQELLFVEYAVLAPYDKQNKSLSAVNFTSAIMGIVGRYQEAITEL